MTSLDDGGRIVQETRLLDSAAGVTVSMRSKEEAHDYRYFPEPDLPPVLVTADAARGISSGDAVELPDARRRRFVAAYGLPEYDAAQLTQSRELADFFEAAVAAGAAPKAASNWMMGELARVLKDSGVSIAESPIGRRRVWRACCRSSKRGRSAARSRRTSSRR